jgi:transcriptional regulator with GAF, ATPase, and Fis domain
VQTETDLYGERPGAVGAPRWALYVAFHGHEPLRPPVRYALDGIDAVCFGRGAAAATRDRHGGLRRLTLRIDDPLMSVDHGALLHARGTWALDDPRSKNGALVGGERTRACELRAGQVLALGHTVLLLAREPAAPDRPLTLDASQLAAPRPELATFDPALAAGFAALARVAPTELPVLLHGETGTGKEVAARALHELSARRGAFVAVNCGAIPAALVESELFGHRRGAFSGAVADRPGHLRSADRGTVFLDEIAELPLPAQAAILRALQEREVMPLGESTPVPVDLRVCAATHRDLAAAVTAGAFREDLYARIQGLALTLPPLRARRADLGLLIGALLRRRAGAGELRVTPRAAIALFEYAWPRNVRELERALGLMVALAGGAPIGVEHLPPALRDAGSAEAPPPAGAPERGEEPVDPGAEAAPPLSAEDEQHRDALVGLLEELDHNVAEVARRLGKDRTQIYRWMRRLGIRRQR